MPRKIRRGWLTFPLVLAPLGLGYLWCAYVDPKAFGKFTLGMLLTVFSGAFVLGAYVLRKPGLMKRPLAAALVIVGGTLASIVLAFIAGALGVATMFQNSDEAYWALTLWFMLLAPIVLVTGCIRAATKYAEIKRHRHLQERTGGNGRADDVRQGLP